MLTIAAQTAEAVLTVRDLSHTYGERRALDRVSFELRPGRFTALLGPNGAGKTTLFSLLTRLIAVHKGCIEIGGLDLSEHGSRALAPLGVVFQQPTLDLDLTVRQNLAYFAALRGLSRREARQRMTQALAALGMAERAGERVRALNGGHRRRVEIARALLDRPRVLLLDEPTVGLDVPARRALVDHAHRLAAEDGVAVLWATHLIDEIDAGDDLLLLDRGALRARGMAREVMSRHRAANIGELFHLLTGDGEAWEAAQ
jgi:ABC-2 type transport system ATP-binding protein